MSPEEIADRYDDLSPLVKAILENDIKEVIAAEREACAKVAEVANDPNPNALDCVITTRKAIVDAIRARSTATPSSGAVESAEAAEHSDRKCSSPSPAGLIG